MAETLCAHSSDKRHDRIPFISAKLVPICLPGKGFRKKMDTRVEARA
jgi:hypothetical protein